MPFCFCSRWFTNGGLVCVCLTNKRAVTSQEGQQAARERGPEYERPEAVETAPHGRGCKQLGVAAAENVRGEQEEADREHCRAKQNVQADLGERQPWASANAGNAALMAIETQLGMLIRAMSEHAA